MYVIYDLDTGIVDRIFHGPKVQLNVNVYEGQSFIEVKGPEVLVHPEYSYVENGEWVWAPDAPPHHEWDWATKSWLPNLDAAKAAKKGEIETERNSRINEPLIYDGKVLDAGQAARDNLKARLEEVRERIRLNMPMAPELLVWRDNANVTHSWPTIEAYHDWLAGYAVAMSDRGTRCYACAWHHKDTIEQLTTVETVMNYTISHGWPA